MKWEEGEAISEFRFQISNECQYGGGGNLRFQISNLKKEIRKERA
jgi:hypothetical protein